MKQFLLLAFTTTIAIASVAQTKFNRNDIYLEAGGNGLFGSVNYERQLTKQHGPGVRVGIGFYSENAFYLTIPVGVNYLLSINNDKSFLEVGLGVTWARVDAQLFGSSKNSQADHFTNFIPSVGYRRHTSQNLMWRISVSPVINEDAVTPWLGF